MPFRQLQDLHWSWKLQSDPGMAVPPQLWGLGLGDARAVRAKARAATIVKNLAILIKFLVVLGELSRLERIVVRCESEATDAGGFQDSHESSTEAYYIDLETPMFAGAHTTLDT